MTAAATPGGGALANVVDLYALPARSLTGDGVRVRRYAEAIAQLPTWPDHRTPAIERRLWRSRRAGALSDGLLVTVRDPFTASRMPPSSSPGAAEQFDHAAAAERRELLRPLDELGLRRSTGRLRESCASAAWSACHVAELGGLDAKMPEGPDTLPGVFAQLIAGLQALDGPVGVSMLAYATGPYAKLASDDPFDDEPADDEEPRRVGFTLRLFAQAPLPAPLLARALALTQAAAGAVDTWAIAPSGAALLAARNKLVMLDPAPVSASDQPAASGTASGRVAAITMALPASLPASGHRQVACGRVVHGQLPRHGAPLGRVARPGGRSALRRLAWEERLLHTLVAAGSGWGKTTALRRLVDDDLAAGRGVVLLDPHGDLADEVCAAAGRERVVLIDPEMPGSWPLDLLDRDPHRASAALLSSLREVWPDEWVGPIATAHCGLVLRALAAAGRPLTVADLSALLTEPGYLRWVLRELGGSDLAGELQRASASWHVKPTDGSSSLAMFLGSKVAPLLDGPLGVVCRSEPPRSWEQLIAERSVVVVRLAVGASTPEPVRLAGRMLLARLTSALAATSHIAADERPQTSVIVDEAHLFRGQALAGLFSQARKFGASITVAVQALSQLGEHRGEVLSSCQTTLLGRLSGSEAQLMVERIGAPAARQLPRVPRHHLLLSTVDDDPDEEPVVLTPIKPPAVDAAALDGLRGARADAQPPATWAPPTAEWEPLASARGSRADASGAALLRDGTPPRWFGSDQPAATTPAEAEEPDDSDSMLERWLSARRT
ncbi:MAG: hypothetical protein QM679_07140 [Patulibacter sp.]